MLSSGHNMTDAHINSKQLYKIKPIKLPARLEDRDPTPS